MDVDGVDGSVVAPTRDVVGRSTKRGELYAGEVVDGTRVDLYRPERSTIERSWRDCLTSLEERMHE